MGPGRDYVMQIEWYFKGVNAAVFVEERNYSEMRGYARRAMSIPIKDVPSESVDLDKSRRRLVLRSKGQDDVPLGDWHGIDWKPRT